MSCGVGRRCGSDPALLWLWHRPVATAPIEPLAWEPPYAEGAALEKAKSQKNKQKKRSFGLSIGKDNCPTHSSRPSESSLLSKHVNSSDNDLECMCISLQCSTSLFPTSRTLLRRKWAPFISAWRGLERPSLPTGLCWRWARP